MATIKDIAKKAGVAQGTVSNVLNGKGNVSSDKIRRVMEAARQLGYVPNERAALLRKGTNDCLALIMPDSRARQYEDFYFSFKDYAQEHGYLVSRHLTNENSPESEATAFSEAKVKQVKGIACISAVAGTASEAAIYKNNGIFGEMEPAQNNGSDIPVLFVDRKTGFPSDFIGFDYEKAGQAMAEKALQAGYPIRQEELYRAYRQLPRTPYQRLRAACDLLALSARALCQVHMARLVPGSPAETLNRFLADHLAEDLSSDRICAALGMGRTALYQLSKETYGCGINESVRRLRIQRAIRLLTTTRLTNNQICQQIGIADYNYFFRVFRRQTGFTPQAYRRQFSGTD